MIKDAKIAQKKKKKIFTVDSRPCDYCMDRPYPIHSFPFQLSENDKVTKQCTNQIKVSGFVGFQ